MVIQVLTDNKTRISELVFNLAIPDRKMAMRAAPTNTCMRIRQYPPEAEEIGAER